MTRAGVDIMKTKTSETNGAFRAPLVGFLVSVTATGLAVAHIAAPGIHIDAVVVALAIVAVLPWLGPLFKSIEFPGGWRVEFQDFKRTVTTQLQVTGERVNEIGDRVEEIKRLTIGAGVEPDVASALESVAARFHDYLVACGAGEMGSPPSVRVDDHSDNAFYESDARAIVLGRRLADDPDVILREYAHHVLATNARASFSELPKQAQGLESGLADYFACSFKGDPVFGRRSARLFGDLQSTRDLSQAPMWPAVQRSETLQRLGAAWGGGFWELRGLVGSDRLDRALIKAWAKADLKTARGLVERFEQTLYETLGDGRVLEVFGRRGFVPTT
jgi:hypothetical protein